MPGAWHPKRWWNFCLSEDEKKKKQNLQCASAVYNMEVLGYFATEIIHEDLIQFKNLYEFYQVFGTKCANSTSQNSLCRFILKVIYIGNYQDSLTQEYLIQFKNLYELSVENVLSIVYY